MTNKTLSHQETEKRTTEISKASQAPVEFPGIIKPVGPMRAFDSKDAPRSKYLLDPVDEQELDKSFDDVDVRSGKDEENGTSIDEEELKRQYNQTFTTSGTKRIRKPKRSREEIGGDPNTEANKLGVRLSVRIPRQLRDQFAQCTKANKTSQTIVLTYLIESYLQEHYNASDNKQ